MFNLFHRKNDKDKTDTDTDTTDPDAKKLEEKESEWVKLVNQVAEQQGKDIRHRRVQCERPLNQLEEISEKYKPSKRNHNYLRYYGEHFHQFRDTAKKVCEIGVETPRSLEMWEEYFPNAGIYGIDIDETCKRVEGGRKQVFIGDQHNRDFLLGFIEETGGDFDIIIDDGLHTERSILTSFSYLYPALKEGGLYVVEDIINQRYRSRVQEVRRRKN